MKRLAVATFVAVVSSAALAAHAADPATPASAAAAEPDAAARAAFEEANAHRERIATGPTYVSGSPVTPSAEDLAIGRHGLVSFAGILGVDGRLHYIQVTESSGYPSLDAAAVSGMEQWVFTPAKDSSGAPVSMIISLPVTVIGFGSRAADGGLSRYGCAQFTRDLDWWRSVNPDAGWMSNMVYGRLATLGLEGSMSGGNFAQAYVSFNKRWDQAIAKCRAQPEKRLADMIQPEGRMLDRMARDTPPH